jgi:hypothetical protein
MNATHLHMCKPNHANLIQESVANTCIPESTVHIDKPTNGRYSITMDADALVGGENWRKETIWKGTDGWIILQRILQRLEVCGMDSSGLRHCATSKQIVGSILDSLAGISHCHNPSGCTMALGLTQPLMEMSTRNISWGYRRPVRKDDLTTFLCRMSWNLGASTSWNPVSLSRPVMGFLYLYLT